MDKILKVRIPIFCNNKRVSDKIEKELEGKEEGDIVKVEIAPSDYSVRDLVVYGDSIKGIVLIPYAFDEVSFEQTEIIIPGIDITFTSPESVDTLDALIDSVLGI
jgi:hypothetical protein